MSQQMSVWAMNERWEGEKKWKRVRGFVYWVNWNNKHAGKAEIHGNKVESAESFDMFDGNGKMRENWRKKIEHSVVWRKRAEEMREKRHGAVGPWDRKTIFFDLCVNENLQGVCKPISVLLTCCLGERRKPQLATRFTAQTSRRLHAHASMLQISPAAMG